MDNIHHHSKVGQQQSIITFAETILIQTYLYMSYPKKKYFHGVVSEYVDLNQV